MKTLSDVSKGLTVAGLLVFAAGGCGHGLKRSNGNSVTKRDHMERIDGISNETAAKAERLWRKFAAVDKADPTAEHELFKSMEADFSAAECLAIGVSDNGEFSNAGLAIALRTDEAVDDGQATRLVKVYRQVEVNPRRWIRRLLARNARVGIPFLLKAMQGGEAPEIQVEAATLVRQSTVAQPEETQRAIRRLLEVLGLPGYGWTAAGIGQLDPWAYRYLAELVGKPQTPESRACMAASLLAGRILDHAPMGLSPEELRAVFDAAFARPGCREAAVQGYGALGFTKAQQPLLRTLANDADQKVRLAIYRTLAEVGEPFALPLLIAGLADEDSTVQETCLRALDKRNAREAMVALIQLLERAMEKDASFLHSPGITCAAGALVVRLAGLSGISFEQRLESFHFGDVGGIRVVDQSAEFAAATRKVLDWWHTTGAKEFGQGR